MKRFYVLISDQEPTENYRRINDFLNSESSSRYYQNQNEMVDDLYCWIKSFFLRKGLSILNIEITSLYSYPKIDKKFEEIF
jgi:hypothetical protein